MPRPKKSYTLIIFFDINNTATSVHESTEDAIEKAQECLAGHDPEPLMFYLAEGSVTALQINRDPTVSLPSRAKTADSTEPKPRRKYTRRTPATDAKATNGVVS